MILLPSHRGYFLKQLRRLVIIRLLYRSTHECIFYPVHHPLYISDLQGGKSLGQGHRPHSYLVARQPSTYFFKLKHSQVSVSYSRQTNCLGGFNRLFREREHQLRRLQWEQQ
jgi:hypothetical protein